MEFPAPILVMHRHYLRFRFIFLIKIGRYSQIVVFSLYKIVSIRVLPHYPNFPYNYLFNFYKAAKLAWTDYLGLRKTEDKYEIKVERYKQMREIELKRLIFRIVKIFILFLFCVWCLRYSLLHGGIKVPG